MTHFRKLSLALVALATLSVGACNDDPNDFDTDADEVIEVLCDAVDRCDPSLNDDDCEDAMYSSIGNSIWDNFGLADESSTTFQVEEDIANGVIQVDDSNLQSCLDTIVEICDNEGEAVDIGSYGNVENIIPEDGGCPEVLSRP